MIYAVFSSEAQFGGVPADPSLTGGNGASKPVV